MASGILGQVSLASTTNTTIYTVPGSTLAVVNINILNRDASATADIRVAISTQVGTSITDKDYIEYDTTIPAKGILERTAIALDSGKNIVAYASTSTCSINVYGLEQSV
tara:strand:+ start:318 stop:644 length:327 start_codon:yes stop_codon:yes gene_type:complete